jgi:hypothetical protein
MEMVDGSGGCAEELNSEKLVLGLAAELNPIAHRPSVEYLGKPSGHGELVLQIAVELRGRRSAAIQYLVRVSIESKGILASAEKEEC